MSDDQILSCEIIPRLPYRFNTTEGGLVPTDLGGATILAVGTLPQAGAVEGGGLVIDYRAANGVDRRVVFAFNDTGMWVSHEGVLGGSPTQAAS